LTQTIQVANPGLATYVVTGLVLRRTGLQQRRCRKR
jgi:hypothetical protein